MGVLDTFGGSDWLAGAGEFVDWLGTELNLPEWGISEVLAGGPTTNTYQDWLAGQNMSTQPQQSPYTPPADSGTPTPTPTPTGDGGGLGSYPQDQYVGWDPVAAQADWEAKGGQTSGGGTPDPYAQLKSEISSGWDAYIASLDQMLNQGLPSQRTAQTGIAESQYSQGQNVLGTQLQQGQDLLGTQRERTQKNQARTLRDLTGNIRNMFQTGNVMLGSMGAGDSSAANQYSHALTKLGSRQRGDVMRQGADIMKEVDARESNLKNIFDSEVRNLGFERDQKIGQIASWFSDAQMQLQQAQASGQLGKSQDLASVSKTILTNALNQLNTVQQDAKDRYSALEQWAINNSDTISQLRTNMQNVSQYAPNMPGYQKMQGSPTVDPRGNLSMPIGYGSQEEEKQPLFQNPSWLT